MKARQPIFRFSSRLSHLSLSSLPSSPSSDFLPPSFFTNAYNTISKRSQIHQYSRSYGNLQLCDRISQIYSKKLMKKLNSASEILICAGSNAGFFNLIQSLVNEGENVAMIGPNWSLEKKVVEVNGGVVKEVKGGTEGVDLDQLRKYVEEGTKLLVLSSPHVCTGKILLKEELEGIWNIVKDHKDLKIVFDARYEMNNFTKKEICYYANEEMRERTLYLYGADKIFHSSDLNVGWVIGPAALLTYPKYSHNISVFCMYNPIQLAIEESLDKIYDTYQDGNNYIDYMNGILKKNIQLIENKILKKTNIEGGWSYLGEKEPINFCRKNFEMELKEMQL